MRFPMLPIWSAKKRSVASAPKNKNKDRSQVRVGIPKVLNVWTTIFQSLPIITSAAATRAKRSIISAGREGARRDNRRIRKRSAISSRQSHC